MVDRRRIPITDPPIVYSGCYVRASISFYPFNTNGNRGIACGLQNVQLWCDGEPLNGRVRAEDESMRWTMWMMRTFWTEFG